MYSTVSNFSKSQLFACFTRIQPSLTLNSIIGYDQLYHLLEQMSFNVSGQPYDEQTFSELVERVTQMHGSLTIENFLEVHMQAVEVLSNRVEQQRVNQLQLSDFIADLRSKVNQNIPNAYNSNDQGFYLYFKQFTIHGQLPSNGLQVRILNDALSIDQTMQFLSNGISHQIIINDQKVAIDSLQIEFQIEVFDNSRNHGFCNLHIYQLGIDKSKKVSIPLNLDSIKTGVSLEIEGRIVISNAQFATEDLGHLQTQFQNLNEDIAGSTEQLRGLKTPFESFNVVPAITAAPPKQVSQYANPGPSYSDQIIYNNPNQVNRMSHNVQAIDEGARKVVFDQPRNGECDVSTQSLVRQIHFLLLGYLFAAVFFCVKRQMFLDVTISIAFFAVIYKINLANDVRAPTILKFFSSFFVLSAIMDLAWLIVFFPAWNSDVSSEDQGAQGVVRIIILGLSLLFMVYKILMIVAIFYLQNSINANAHIVKQAVYTFLNGPDQVKQVSSQQPQHLSSHY